MFQTWIDETEKREDKWFDYNAGITSGVAVSVGSNAALGWVQTRMKELTDYTQGANYIINTSVQEAWGPPGTPGDAYKIVTAAKKLGEIYEAFLNWTTLVRSAFVEKPFDAVVVEMRKFPDLECVPKN